MAWTGQFTIWAKWAPPLERSRLTSIAGSGRGPRPGPSLPFPLRAGLGGGSRRSPQFHDASRSRSEDGRRMRAGAAEAGTRRWPQGAGRPLARLREPREVGSAVRGDPTAANADERELRIRTQGGPGRSQAALRP